MGSTEQHTDSPETSFPSAFLLPYLPTLGMFDDRELPTSCKNPCGMSSLAYMGVNSISLGLPSVSPQAVPGLGRFLFHMTAQQKSEAAHTVPSRQISPGLSTALHAGMLGRLSQCFIKIHESFSHSLIKFDVLPVAPALRPLSPFLPVLFFGFL